MELGKWSPWFNCVGLSKHGARDLWVGASRKKRKEEEALERKVSQVQSRFGSVWAKSQPAEW